ncbi:ornithine cyclodeaminase family protein [Thalassospira sp.]|uniref:ornithine cyclodeaminase family protein n=1 Tax=Thalassospira sp. TaxID=1912094 RepID=UPI0027346759|nr:ornithine cyclodeaminase family protein [Thalassospira sp.]MDP2697695.1 ornithine cyclodeaminase family protein [Thalassospira sp.]
MRFVTAEDIDRSVPPRAMVEALRTWFAKGCETPLRSHFNMERSGEDDATLLIMPSWEKDGAAGVKVAAVVPGNAARNLPAVSGIYILLDGVTGQPSAVLDGTRLTTRRTAAASALAADYLARKDASHLVMVGSGALAPNLIAAHASVRPIKKVTIWNRNAAKAQALAAETARLGFDAVGTDDLESACKTADIISCATLSTEPLVRGAWLRAGTHVDLVGAFKPTMRETDDDVMRKCRIFVDSFEGASAEGGDIVQPIKAGVIAKEDILGDLFGLTRGMVTGRQSDDECTVFKSVGHALEDFAAAVTVVGALYQ